MGNIIQYKPVSVNKYNIIPMDVKWCICHFVKWQTHPFISMGTISWLFCETQWRHSVKTRLYNTPSPILPSLKRSDVTRWNKAIWEPSPILHCISQLGENKGGRCHWVSQNRVKCHLCVKVFFKNLFGNINLPVLLYWSRGMCNHLIFNIFFR